MAQNVHLFLKANGSDIEGESTVTSLDREDSIECLSYSSSVTSPADPRTGLSTGRREYGPITIRKRIDKSTPLLHQALAHNQVIEAEFRFYRPSPSGDGTTEQHFTVTISQARISDIRRLLPLTIAPDTASFPETEDVQFRFQTINVAYASEAGSAEFEDGQRSNRAGAF